ncbi:hypothetical protein ACIG0C_10760 [Kitasatospora aureofaciens]|uniref:Uncharacterized protein n=1 Tax=Kitasatospora aureofaciens TaxID=1894 RepID=A0A8H9LKI7_KITAU|nr:hypothetical protein [Kitasatospora aureofaciens]GGU54459.1 hypothetical protein GCM10010502_00670 [Kitasatospora aureofaciens]
MKDEEYPERVSISRIPDPLQVGDWFSFSWDVSLSESVDLSRMELPSPGAGFSGIAALVGAAPGNVRLSVFDRQPVISPGALIYASRIVNHLRENLSSPVMVDGELDNSLFRVSM